MKSFEQIAPLWSEKLKQSFLNLGKKCEIDGQRLDIKIIQYCIVGEAHDFTGGYHPTVNEIEKIDQSCHTCHGFAIEFYQIGEEVKMLIILVETDHPPVVEIATPKIEKCKLDFEGLKDGFVKHWNDEHEDV